MYKILLVQQAVVREREKTLLEKRKEKNARRQEFLENVDFFDVLSKRQKNWGVSRRGIIPEEHIHDVSSILGDARFNLIHYGPVGGTDLPTKNLKINQPFNQYHLGFMPSIAPQDDPEGAET